MQKLNNQKIGALIVTRILLVLCGITFSTSSQSGVFNNLPGVSYYGCTNNPLLQIQPAQNMCQLLEEIPQQLKNLPYALYPTSLRYYLDRFNYNKRFNIYPHAIIQPSREADLIEAVNFLRLNNVPFSIRSGGHCSEPGSLSSEYVIDLSKFTTVQLNQDGTVYIGAGCRLGGVIEFLARYNYAIPTGTCGSNGIAGLALGGGMGFLARKFGLTCDAIRSIRILTANNGIITVSDHYYPDLFWALRGAGNGSFGIVLGFTFNLSTVPFVSFVQLNWTWDQTQAPFIIKAWQNWLATIPNEITTELDIDYVDGKATITLISIKVGAQPQTEWQAAFQSLNPTVTSNQVMPYVQAARIVGGDSTMPFSKAKSTMIFSPIVDAGIQVIVNFVDQLITNHNVEAVHLEFDSAGGQSAVGNTAYFPRNALAWFFMDINWTDQDNETDALATIDTFYTSITPYTSSYCYANFVDYDLGSTYLNAYYGTNVAQLMQIKQKYDPNNVFNWHQSIPVS